MRRKLPRIVVLIALLCGAAEACGPFFTEETFRFTSHPDFPLELYTRGELGLVLPSFHRTYLAVAFRQFNGGTFTEKERAAILSVWGQRYVQPEERVTWSGKWDDAKARFLGPARKRNVWEAEQRLFRPVGYRHYLNCPADAFRNATETLAARAGQAGVQKSELTEWVRGQEMVFANCDADARVPDAVAANGWLKADRAYQIAAAHFYRGDFDEARARFQTIAVDADSPWRELAPYLAARALVRKATLETADPDPKLLRAAEKELRSILKDKDSKRLHASARDLLAFVRFKTEPLARLRELAEAVAGPKEDARLAQDLIDLKMMLDKLSGEAESPIANPPADWPRVHELTDWIMTMQSSKADAYRRAYQHWQRKRTVPWLVATLTKADGQETELPELVEAAAQIPAGSPAHLTANYHRARLLAAAGQQAAARELLDTTITGLRGSGPRSALNAFLAERLKLARDLDEFADAAIRLPVVPARVEIIETMVYCERRPDCERLVRGRRYLNESTPYFDAESAHMFNRLPLAAWEHIARQEHIPLELRKRVALAAWVRALLLDQVAAAEAAGEAVAEGYPELKGEVAALREVSGEERRFAALLVMLRFPGLRPFVEPGKGRDVDALAKLDDYRDNWWCADAGTTLQHPYYIRGSEDGHFLPASPPAFLMEEEKAMAVSELRGLKRIGAAPNFFAREVLAWAKHRPQDARVPRALHLAVRTTRYGCNDGETGKWSRAAFEWLHRRYPQSEWAKRTPYWFD